MIRLVERFTLAVTAVLVIGAVVIETKSGGGLPGILSAALAAFCLGLSLFYVSRGVMVLVEPQAAGETTRSRLELMHIDLLQLEKALAALRLDARLQARAVDDEEQVELEAPLVERIEVLRARIERVEKDGEESALNEELLEMARERMSKSAAPSRAGAEAEAAS